MQDIQKELVMARASSNMSRVFISFQLFTIPLLHNNYTILLIKLHCIYYSNITKQLNSNKAKRKS